MIFASLTRSLRRSHTIPTQQSYQMHHKRASLEPAESPEPAMKVEYSAAYHSPSKTLEGPTLACDDTKKLLNTEYEPFLTLSNAAPWLVVNPAYGTRQRTLHDDAISKPSIDYLCKRFPMTHPEGHCDQFPAPPKAWECCGCKQRFYNFEKQCNFCATLYCKDCKKIPWK